MYFTITKNKFFFNFVQYEPVLGDTGFPLVFCPLALWGGENISPHLEPRRPFPRESPPKRPSGSRVPASGLGDNLASLPVTDQSRGLCRLPRRAPLAAQARAPHGTFHRAVSTRAQFRYNLTRKETFSRCRVPKGIGRKALSRPSSHRFPLPPNGKPFFIF